MFRVLVYASFFFWNCVTNAFLSHVSVRYFKSSKWSSSSLRSDDSYSSDDTETRQSKGSDGQGQPGDVIYSSLLNADLESDLDEDQESDSGNKKFIPRLGLESQLYSIGMSRGLLSQEYDLIFNEFGSFFDASERGEWPKPMELLSDWEKGT